MMLAAHGYLCIALDYNDGSALKATDKEGNKILHKNFSDYKIDDPNLKLGLRDMQEQRV